MQDRDVLYEYSYGIVPLKKDLEGWKLFMVCHKSGHWSLPKGHAEGHESPLESATRELYEETSLRVHQLLTQESFVETYRFFRKHEMVEKRVEYFIALVDGDVVIQEQELQDGLWLSIEEAFTRATYLEMKKLLKNVQSLLEIR